MARTKHSIAPADIAEDAEALAEWDRIVVALAKSDRKLAPIDRSILILHCRTWSINCACFAHVKQYGAIIKWPNGIPGASPQFKTFNDTLKVLRGTLADLGCTPAARNFDAAAKKEPAPTEDLSF